MPRHAATASHTSSCGFVPATKFSTRSAQCNHYVITYLLKFLDASRRHPEPGFFSFSSSGTKTPGPGSLRADRAPKDFRIRFFSLFLEHQLSDFAWVLTSRHLRSSRSKVSRNTLFLCQLRRNDEPSVSPQSYQPMVIDTVTPNDIPDSSPVLRPHRCTASWSKPRLTYQSLLDLGNAPSDASSAK